jgi:hypothetical protein
LKKFDNKPFSKLKIKITIENKNTLAVYLYLKSNEINIKTVISDENSKTVNIPRFF